MKFRSVRFNALTPAAKRAAEILRGEFLCRGIPVEGDTEIVFEEKDLPYESFETAEQGGKIILSASSLRGFIYGGFRFLRKTEKQKDGWELLDEFFGSFAPKYRYRGHQFGYRPKNNTCDSWNPDQFRQAFLDIMAFGSNTAELMPGGTDDGERNELMSLSENEMLFACSEKAAELDIEVSVWYPNCEESTKEESAEIRGKVFSQMKRLDYVFPPGGDPGHYDAEEFLDRAVLASRKMQESHPNAKMFPSAQKPKGRADWGDRFIAYMEKLPPEIHGVITGPNEAMDIDSLRRRLPMKYPLRYYPDITHNVRCTFPVHFPRDDWHYALASTLGRESANPRPTEYRHIHRLVSRYCEGSVSYSEGSNDDVNKAVWAALDWDPNVAMDEVLEDYARLFLPGVDPAAAADGLFGLERNWFGDPAENPGIDHTLSIWKALEEDHPELADNWRFILCIFRAECDAVVRKRRVFELSLVKKAMSLLKYKKVDSAIETLSKPYPESYIALRRNLDAKAEKLYRLIGMQLDIANFKASAPDRGATLETIDKPITNRTYLLNRLSALNGEKDLEELMANLVPGEGEYVFSVAEDTCEIFGGKHPDAYLNFKGDGRLNDGSIPMELIGVFDHYYFEGKIAGLIPEKAYSLRIVFPRPRHPVDMDVYLLADGT
ncbi:MAG: hypothetical protein IKZ19_02950, partial [Clostridia bacterium]|nr:hypothetical protein [Clostridia bacterium]